MGGEEGRDRIKPFGIGLNTTGIVVFSLFFFDYCLAEEGESEEGELTQCAAGLVSFQGREKKTPRLPAAAFFMLKIVYTMEGHKIKKVSQVFCVEVLTDEALEGLDVDALQKNRNLKVTRTSFLCCCGHR